MKVPRPHDTSLRAAALPSEAPPRAAYPRAGTWSYDGTLEGLLVLAHRAFTLGAVPEAVANALAAEGELFALLGPAPFTPAPPRNLRSGLEREAETACAELRAFSGRLFDLIIRIWMSEESLEIPLFRLCVEASLHGEETLYDHASADLRAVSQAARRVDREIDRLKGLARFSPRKDGLFCAPLEPDANVAFAIMPHFARRFGSEDFAVVDLKRRLAFARRRGRYESAVGEEALAFLPAPAAGADEEVQLWRRYFHATENPARRNPELQRRLMPLRYWRYLPEIGGQN
jgi:uracil-DNA glycosylase